MSRPALDDRLHLLRQLLELPSRKAGLVLGRDVDAELFLGVEELALHLLRHRVWLLMQAMMKWSQGANSVQAAIGRILNACFREC
jgi:hypothetical protein